MNSTNPAPRIVAVSVWPTHPRTASRSPQVSTSGSATTRTRARASDASRSRGSATVRSGSANSIENQKREPCPRDYCAIYRTEALRKHGLSFVGKGGYSAGETVYYDLKAQGYHSEFVPVREMMSLMDHIAHATGAIVPERKLDRAHTFRKTRRRLKGLFNRRDAEALLADDSLDR